MSVDPLTTLRDQLQAAIELEHATIPMYLFALYSIKPNKNQDVADILEGIVTEEMIHLSLAANVLNAIGGEPKLAQPEFTPRYGPDCRMPRGLMTNCPLTLAPCSLDQIQNVFMEIEEPEYEQVPAKPPFAGRLVRIDDPDAIGAFYRRIKRDIDSFQPANTLFSGSSDRQVTAWDGRGHGISKVTDRQSAVSAIEEIIHQGEGTSSIDPTVHRRDAAGHPTELSHYYRLLEIVHGKQMRVQGDSAVFTGQDVLFDPAGVWPVKPNLKLDDPDLRRNLPLFDNCVEFNRTYCRLLRVLHNAFNGEHSQLGTAVGLMFSLKLQAIQLVQLPIDPQGDPDVGPNAGPTFEYVAPA